MSYVSSQPAHHVTSAGVGQTDSSFHVSSILEQQQQALNAAIHAFDQVPAPSLREVLGAYRLKGDGDREMLLAILNAKAAEDQVRVPRPRRQRIETKFGYSAWHPWLRSTRRFSRSRMPTRHYLPCPQPVLMEEIFLTPLRKATG